VAARALLGALLVREGADGRRVGRIVEVEAYGGPEDRASHARSGRMARNGSMFGPPGHAYVYRVYGMHLCLNVVSGPDGDASAILVRAVEPVTGFDAMRRARLEAAAAGRRVADAAADAADAARIRALPGHRLASGPGLVGAAFSVDPSLDGADLCVDGPLQLRLPAVTGVPGATRVPGADPGGTAGRPRPADPTLRVASGPRVGVAYAGAPWTSVAWRFAIADSPALSLPLPPASAPHPAAEDR
jgi:DNA-3-methyladenine glycosylase